MNTETSKRLILHKCSIRVWKEHIYCLSWYQNARWRHRLFIHVTSRYLHFCGSHKYFLGTSKVKWCIFFRHAATHSILCAFIVMLGVKKIRWTSRFLLLLVVFILFHLNKLSGSWEIGAPKDHTPPQWICVWVVWLPFQHTFHWWRQLYIKEVYLWNSMKRSQFLA